MQFLYSAYVKICENCNFIFIKENNKFYLYMFHFFYNPNVFHELHVSCSCLAVHFGKHCKLIINIISYQYKNFCELITKSDHNSVNNIYKYKKMIFSNRKYYGLTRLHLQGFQFSIIITYDYMKIHCYSRNCFSITSIQLQYMDGMFNDMLISFYFFL